MTERRTPVELSRRNHGGIRLDQGGSFIMLDRTEALQLIKNMQTMLAEQAETRIDLPR
jgi:hypothetical protein